VLIAVDTNVLLDHALDDADVLDAISTIKKRLPNARLVVLPTTLEELGHQVSHGDEEEKAAAEKALLCMIEWGYEPVNLVAVGKGITEQICFKLRSSGVLPEEEVNDGYIIAEAALLGCAMLLSSDHHLIEAGLNDKFLKVLKESDVEGDHMVIGSPRTIATRFFVRK
jgi:predicted nucleic acid-binding protein